MYIYFNLSKNFYLLFKITVWTSTRAGIRLYSRKTMKNQTSKISGTLAAFLAYGMWGLFPLYWKMLKSVEPLQILSHRIFWAAVFCLILLGASKQLSRIGELFRSPRKVLRVAACAIVVTANWGIYIWAVNSGRITESALGYYINPLLSVAFGVLFFRERADVWTKAAVSVAALAIFAAAVIYGSVPWVSLLLAVTFAGYGALKKQLALDPLLGLTIETLMVAPLAFGYLAIRQFQGTGAIFNASLLVTALLILAGAVTAIPLLFFAKAANSISLQKMGFIQYVSPTGQLFLGLVVFHEKPTSALLVAFAGVIAAVLMYVLTRKRVAEKA